MPDLKNAPYYHKKAFPGLFTAILFSLNIALIIFGLPLELAFISSLILSLNLFIILAAIYLGANAVIIFAAVSLLTCFLYSLQAGESLLLPLISLSATSALSYYLFVKQDRFIHAIGLKREELDEQYNVLAAQLEHIRLENNALRQKLQRYITLKDLSAVLSSTLSLEKTILLLADETLRIINKSRACLIYLLDKKKQNLELAGTKLTDPGQGLNLKNGDIFDSWVFKHRSRLMVEDTKKDFRFSVQDITQDERGVRSLICAPLIRENRLLGILRLDNIHPRTYDTDDLRLLDIISDLAAVTIENSLLYQETQRLAITDGLTGLFVHRYFQERFQDEVCRSLKTQSQFAFLMLDIDDFKSYNDKYGHIAGDIVLKQIAQIIRTAVNPGDIAARYGGEEFALLLVDTNAQDALNLADEIREKIEKKMFVLRRQATEVRVSGGVSLFPQHGKAVEILIQKADQALYRAKAEGKNRICTA